MGKGRTSKYPIELIERDFIEKRLTFKELMPKYKISKDLLSYHSRRRNWIRRRKDLYKKTTIAITTKVENKKANELAKGEMTLIERFEKLLKLKLNAELEVFFDRVGVKTKKDLMYLVNKSKDSTTEIAKLLELLKGNATDRVEVKPQEKQKRFDRLKEFMVAN